MDGDRLDKFMLSMVKITKEIHQMEAIQDFEKCEYLNTLMLRMITQEAKMLAFGSVYTEQEWYIKLIKTKENLYNNKTLN